MFNLNCVDKVSSLNAQENQPSRLNFPQKQSGSLLFSGFLPLLDPGDRCESCLLSWHVTSVGTDVHIINEADVSGCDNLASVLTSSPLVPADDGTNKSYFFNGKFKRAKF